MKIVKTKNGYSCRASITIDGRQHQKQFKASTKKDLQDMVAKWKACPVPSQSVSRDSVAEAIARYIDSVEGVLSPSTIRLYHTMHRNCYKGIENLSLSNLDNITVQKWISSQANRYSLKYLKNMLNLLSIVCKEHGTEIHARLPQKRKEDKHLPELEDVQKGLQVTEGTKIEGQYRFALYLGLRQSEIYALRWEDIQGNQVFIHSAKVMDKNWRYVEKTTKTSAGTRTLFIPSPLMEWINAHRSSGQIFDVKPTHVDRIWKRIREKENLPFRFHDLRKANASILLLLGVPDKYIMQRLGWADYSTMKNIYQYVFQSEQSKLDSTIDDYFSKL